MKRSISIVALVALSSISSSAIASEPVDQAHALFARGIELYREGSFEQALVHFRRAHEISPNPRVLYNIGQAALLVRDYASALRAFERYLAEGDVPEARKATLLEEVARLERRVGRITIRSSFAEAEVLVDEMLAGRVPSTEPILVSSGRRRVTIVPRVGAPTTRVFEIAGGESVTFEANPEVTPAALARSPEPSESATHGAQHPPPSTGAWIATGLAAALAIGGGTAFAFALDAKSDLDTEKRRYPSDPREVEDARSRLQTTAVVADVLGLAALAAGGVAAVLFVRGKPEPSPAVTAAATRAGAGLRVRF